MIHKKVVVDLRDMEDFSFDQLRSNYEADEQNRHNTQPEPDDIENIAQGSSSNSDPSNSPTKNPTESPTRRPTTNPTTVPTVSPTAAPSLPDCIVDDNGVYGDTGSENTKNEISFNYQVSLSGDELITKDDMENEILSKLENSITANILPELFQDSCNKNIEIRQRRGLQESLTGISAQPSDEVLDDVLCSGPISNCFVIDGKMTVYGNNGSSNLVLQAIEKSMTDGVFDDGKVDARISSVGYLDNIVGLTGIRGGILQNDSINTRFPIWGMVVIGVSGLVLLSGALGFVYRRRRYSDEETTLFSKPNPEERGATRVTHPQDTVDRV